jgi:UDP-N-acetylmuramoyl-tripeptide--D-alanyl-D-alanine ligase
MWPVESIIKGVGGKALRIEGDSFRSISTDSRTIGPGEFFIPLKGPNFDGHLYAEAAYERSGGGCLCDGSRPEVYERAKGTVILVDDTNKALLDLATFKRGETRGTFIAITGSNGKTTTKELLVHLAADHVSLAFSEKNYNNQIGVAKTILAIEGNPEFVLLELGTNHDGEIGVLSGMVQPHMSLITNVNPSHLEGLFDLEGVRREKLSLFETTLPGGLIFINADDPSLVSYKAKKEHRVSTFAIREKAETMLHVIADRGLDGYELVLRFPDGKVTTATRLLGHHNLYNVLAASALAHAMGVPLDAIGEGISTFSPYRGRFNPARSRKGNVVVDDAYNANPTSMRWAISTLAALPCSGKRVAVLGSMRELGDKGEMYHREMSLNLRNSNIALILLLGEETRIVAEEIGASRAHHFGEKKELIRFLSERLDPEDIVLVKGSRALGMDEIVEALA